MIPTFTDYNETEQCGELRTYFVELGADIKIEVNYRENENLQKNLEDLISVLNICIDKEQPNDVECVLNSIVSLLIQVPHTQQYCQRLISMFCQKITESVNEKTSMVCLRVLQNLFEGLGANNNLKYDVYLSLIEIDGNFNKLNSIFDELPKLNQWFNNQTVGIDRLQKLYRLLHKALLQNNQGEQASKVMIELLGTYTEENAANAREDANKCIISFISDPDTFLMDHLLTLKPVKILEGEPLHDLLTIFVADKLNDYIQFYNKNKDFVESLGLNHENSLQKMRLLTFMQIAERTKEIKFESIEQELQLNSDEVEGFIVDVLRTKLVKAKVDQVNRRVYVTSTMHRTFGKPQWNMLKQILTKWSDNLDNVNITLGNAIRNSSSLQLPITFKIQNVIFDSNTLDNLIGTTIFAIKFKEGVIVAADSISFDTLHKEAKENQQKIFNLIEFFKMRSKNKSNSKLVNKIIESFGECYFAISNFTQGGMNAIINNLNNFFENDQNSDYFFNLMKSSTLEAKKEGNKFSIIFAGKNKDGTYLVKIKNGNLEKLNENVYTCIGCGELMADYVLKNKSLNTEKEIKDQLEILFKKIDKLFVNIDKKPIEKRVSDCYKEIETGKWLKVTGGPHRFALLRTNGAHEIKINFD